MYCPKCGSEYQPGLEECAFCHVPLVAEQPAPESVSRPEPLVVVFASSWPDRVVVAESLLASAGIEAVVEGEWGSSMAGALGRGPMTVLVRASDEEAAQEMLWELEPGDDEDDEDLVHEEPEEYEEDDSPQDDVSGAGPRAEDESHVSSSPSPPGVSLRRALSETLSMRGFYAAALIGGGAQLAIAEFGNPAAMSTANLALAAVVGGYCLTFQHLVRLGDLRLPGQVDARGWIRRSAAAVVIGGVPVLLVLPALIVAQVLTAVAAAIAPAVAPAVGLVGALVLVTLGVLLVEASALRFVAFDRVSAGLQYRMAARALGKHLRDFFTVIGWSVAFGATVGLLQWASGAVLGVHIPADKGVVRIALENPGVTTTLAGFSNALCVVMGFGFSLVATHMAGQLAAEVYPLREGESAG